MLARTKHPSKAACALCVLCAVWGGRVRRLEEAAKAKSGSNMRADFGLPVLLSALLGCGRERGSQGQARTRRHNYLPIHMTRAMVGGGWVRTGRVLVIIRDKAKWSL